jgi:hypothetical protein
LNDITKWIGTVVGIGVSFLVLVIATFAFNFRTSQISSDPSDWGVFGDFVGGLANPFLSFLTISLLAMTLVLQVRQLVISANELKLSREELEMTRAELRRSASAQELSEKALRAQASAAEATAKLAAINALMRHYQDEISRQQGFIYPNNDPRRLELENLKQKHESLKKKLDGFYSTLIGDKDD